VSTTAEQVSRRSVPDAHADAATRRTVNIAMVSNGIIAVAKLAAGLMTGSSAMLAETAHSLADTVNQGFLLASIALAGRPPNERQPFGYGQQRFLFTFMAAVGMFVAGAAFAVGYGLYTLVAGEASESGYAIAWITLAVAAVAEGSSWARAVHQTRTEAREAGRGWADHVRSSRDPNVKMVLFEDSAALVGIALAAAGIGLDQLTGSTFWDPAASIAIGVLLIGVAVWMARDASHLLVGAAARPDEVAAIEGVIEDHDAVLAVHELLTLVLGPNALMVAARIDFDDTLDAAHVERASSELDAEIRRTVPDVAEVFLDATPPRER
jgi:cation diffusion facilitator family transporter